MAGRGDIINIAAATSTASVRKHKSRTRSRLAKNNIALFKNILQDAPLTRFFWATGARGPAAINDATCFPQRIKKIEENT